MGKIVALFIVAFGFLGFLFIPQSKHVQEQQPTMVRTTVVVVPTVTIEVVAPSDIQSHLAAVCQNASIAKFGDEFDKLDAAIALCTSQLVSIYTELGHWPGIGTYRNSVVSEGFYAANCAAEAWQSLDLPYQYYTEDGRDEIMRFLREQRLALGL